MKYLISILTVMIVALVAGCTGSAAVPEMQDCGSDWNCFKPLSDTCTPAKVQIKTLHIEMHGYETGMCGAGNMKSKCSACKVKYSSDRTGKEMSCTVPKEILTMMQKYGGLMSYGDLQKYCDGSID